ncbi:hypothetical protein NPIL_107881 [Nephila pilipes]|uniref:Uncharacterized protein n=1 Tax=Nephila pilipes TaxID=299642 RepID=A0A8X6QYG2_NEPPI|nr:hypothetical protein NPIL_107881 [Nephila pilipes]
MKRLFREVLLYVVTAALKRAGTCELRSVWRSVLPCHADVWEQGFCNEMGWGIKTNESSTTTGHVPLSGRESTPPLARPPNPHCNRKWRCLLFIWLFDSRFIDYFCFNRGHTIN